MNLHELKPQAGARTKRKRVGRGIGSGRGKTSGRGHKGQKSRSGGGKGPFFEGGQMPLVRRIPKRGFTNIFSKVYAEVNLSDLNRFDADTVVTPEMLRQERLVRGKVDGVKVLGGGQLDRALTVKAHKFSRSALAAIEAAGGKAEVI